MRTHDRGAWAAVGAAVVALVLAGCAPTPASDGQQNTTPEPSRTVPAPSGGTIDEVVPDATDAATVNAGAGEAAQLPDGVTVSILGTQDVEVEPQTPGEVAGPALAVTVAIRNDGTTALDTGAPIVSLTTTAGVYGQPTTAAPAAFLPESIAPGTEASGTYVFMLPADDRTSFTLTVQYVAGATVAVFTS